MNTNWHKTYIEEKNRARASWKTSPAHRKMVHEKSAETFILGFGALSLIEAVENQNL